MGSGRISGPLTRLTLSGGCAGALNAAHCWATLPEHQFAWHIIPAGAVHGALLALLAAFFSGLLLERSLAARLTAVPLVGWLAGAASFSALNLSLGWGWNMYLFWEKPGELYWPFQAFGLVAALAFLGWGALKLLRAPRLMTHWLTAIFAGMAGSLWWWISMDAGHWYYSLLHGTVWGSAVGLALWSSCGERNRLETAPVEK